MNNWLKELTGTDKAVIAMCHLQPLPGDPYYDKEKGMEYALEAARKDLHALQDGGVDAVMFSNEFSLPYLTDVEPVTVAAMANIIGELKHEIKIPFGVNVLWDAKKSIDLAVATGAAFVREIFTGVYASDFGLWNTNVGETIRHQRAGVRKVFGGSGYSVCCQVHGVCRTTGRAVCFRPDCGNAHGCFHSEAGKGNGAGYRGAGQYRRQRPELRPAAFDCGRCCNGHGL